jgi:hypothetical protein
MASVAAVAGAQTSHDAGWRSLFDGRTLDGWEVKSGFATYTVEDGAIVGRTAEGSGNTFLCTKESFSDFELTFEVLLIDNGLNSGVQIRSLLKGEKYGGRVNGPQVEIAASPGPGGFIYGEALGRWLSPEPTSKDRSYREKCPFKNGQWNEYRVLAVGPRIQTWINGQPIADLTDEETFKTYNKGLIGLQVHGIAKKQVPAPLRVQWRNIKIRPIGNQ